MTISKKLQKILAVTLMTSFLSTSFVMGVSEAASAHHNGGGRPPVQSQQIRRETPRSTYGHQMKAPMQRQSPGHQARPAVHKAPAQRMQPMHKAGPGHKAQPMMHRGGSIRHGGPVIHRGGPVIQHHPAPPPPHHHHGDHRSMHSGDWLGALVVGGIIGAIIANNSHRASHPDYVEYVE